MSSDLDKQLVELVSDVLDGYVEPASGGLPSCWPTLVELGLPSVGAPAVDGDSEGTLHDLVVLCRELASHAAGTPLPTCAVANWALAGQDVPAATLRTVVVADDARPGAGDRVSATLPAVPWGRHAEQILVVGPAGAFVVEPGAGVRITEAVDLAGEPRDVVDLSDAPVRRLGEIPSAHAVRVRLGLLTGASLAGAVRGAYELTRDYVTTREQFGKPLARIPAVAAHLATVRSRVLLAETTLDRAVEILSDTDAEPAAHLASVAALRVVAGQAAGHTARITHQLHGAMGVTAEYPLHRYTRRLWAWRDAGSAERDWAAELGDIVLAGGEAELWELVTAPVGHSRAPGRGR